MKAIASRMFTALALCAIPSLASAQADPLMAGVKAQWESTVGFITQAAEQMSDADYAYRPVATVRTFGELVGHVAGSQHLICAAALGEPQPPEDAVEKAAKTKAALVKALKESTEHCKRAYAISTAAGAGAITLFGGKNTKAGALALNAVHDGEHYGNIVTYMRMKGMVPPSSQPAKK